MFCTNCGGEIREGAAFCPHCGQPIEPRQASQPEASAEAAGDIHSSEGAGASGHDGRPKWVRIVIIAVVAAAVVIVALVVGVSASRRINLNKYVEVTFEGYDGYGTANVTMDWDALSSKYDKRIKVDDSGWGWFYGSFSEIVNDCTYMSVDPQYDLSNGDEVTISWDVDTASIDQLIRKSVKISADPKTYTVSGLEEVEEFDAFETVQIEFLGTSPNATAEIVSAPDDLVITLSDTYDLAVGDVVTATISEDSAMAYAQEYGRIPAELSKDYTVEDVAYYVTSLDQIPEDAMEKMEAQAEDAFHADVAGWSENARLDSQEYIGSYFLTAKEGTNPSTKNAIYVVYSIHATQFGKDESGSQTETGVDYYWYAGFSNGMVLSDGTYSMDYNDYSVPESYWGSASTFQVVTYDYSEEYEWDQEISLTYDGYQDLDSMFNHLITANIDSYAYESTVEDDA